MNLYNIGNTIKRNYSFLLHRMCALIGYTIAMNLQYRKQEIAIRFCLWLHKMSALIGYTIAMNLQYRKQEIANIAHTHTK